MNALILGPRTLGSSYLGAIIHSVFNWALWNAYMHWIMIFITMNCGFCSPQIASLLLIKELWHVWYLYLFRNNKVEMMSFFENEPNSFAPCGNILLYYQLINIIYHWAYSMWMKGLLRIHLDSVQLCPLCPPISIEKYDKWLRHLSVDDLFWKWGDQFCRMRHYTIVLSIN